MGKQLENYSNKVEQSVIDLWASKKIPEKVRQKAEESKQGFFFVDGPPYATGHIHMGTALNKILKEMQKDEK